MFHQQEISISRKVNAYVKVGMLVGGLLQVNLAGSSNFLKTHVFQYTDWKGQVTKDAIDFGLLVVKGENKSMEQRCNIGIGGKRNKGGAKEAN